MNGVVNYRNSFLHSAQARANRFQPFDDTVRWLRELRNECACKVERIPLADIEQWYFDEHTGDLKHRSGKFFSVVGLRCEPRYAATENWEQPIILQPEVGILGIITREFAGTRYFLMQAKMEPGNVNLVQLSPTLQATYSNYSQAHKGKLPPYLQYFLDPAARVINSQEQSETGTRFFRKFNRNVLLDIEEDVELLPGFRWLTLYEIQRLMELDDTVNMDTRSVLSNIPCAGTVDTDMQATVFQHSLTCAPDDARHSVQELRDWLQARRDVLTIDTTRIPLNSVRDWQRDDWAIRHVSGNYFDVAGVRVEGGAREVARWCQPLLKHEGIGLSGFLCSEINGVLHVLLQAKPEPGIVGSVELGPTVSLFDYKARAEHGVEAPYLEHFLQAPATATLHSSIQSEEGGRFWALRNHVLVIQAPQAGSIAAHDNFRWMTLAQLRQLAQGDSVVNSEARTLLACLPLFE